MNLMAIIPIFLVSELSFRGGLHLEIFLTAGDKGAFSTELKKSFANRQMLWDFSCFALWDFFANKKSY